MRCFAQTIPLKDDPESIRRYGAYHANPWPELLEGARKVGILSTYIYRFECQLFMFMLTQDDFDLERDMPSTRRTRRPGNGMN